MGRIDGKAAIDYRIGRHLSRAYKRGQEARSTLASGTHVNRAADDPVVMAVSSRMLHEKQAYEAAATNVREAQVYLERKDGALASLVEATHRMRELAVRAANETVTNAQRTGMTVELNQIKATIAETFEASLNGVRIFSNAAGNVANIQDLDFRVGISTGSGSTIRLEGDSLKAQWNNVRDGIQLVSSSRAVTMISRVESMFDRLIKQRAYVGSIGARMNQAATKMVATIESTGAAEARIRDADFAVATSKVATAQIVTSSATALLSQANATYAMMFELLPETP